MHEQIPHMHVAKPDLCRSENHKSNKCETLQPVTNVHECTVDFQEVTGGTEHKFQTNSVLSPNTLFNPRNL